MTKKGWMLLLSIMFMTGTLLTFTACGDDKVVSPNTQEQTKPVEYNAALLGTWKGSGTNVDGNPLNVTAKFNEDKGGYLSMSAPKENSSFLSALSNWYVSDATTVYLNCERFSAQLRWYVLSGSIPSGKMTVECQGHDGEFWGKVELTKTQSSGSGGGSSTTDDSDKMVTTTALVILQTTGNLSSDTRYSQSTKTCYKKVSGNNVLLYSYPSGTLIGVASKNTDSSRGGYSVSSYSYRYIDPISTSQKRYYYFN